MVQGGNIYSIVLIWIQTKTLTSQLVFFYIIITRFPVCLNDKFVVDRFPPSRE